MAAKLVGAGQIIAVDLRDDRLKLALELGATHTVNPSKDYTKRYQGDNRKRGRSRTRNNRADARSADCFW